MTEPAPRATDALVDELYQELHRLADRFMGREGVGHTLQPTALIHETWLRLAAQGGQGWESQQHFQAIAATMMRRVLVDHARRGKRDKRGGGQRPLTLLTDAPIADDDAPVDLTALDEALDALAALAPRQARVVELRFFGGLSAPEAAAVLEISERTLHREWSLARAWLRQQLEA